MTDTKKKIFIPKLDRHGRIKSWDSRWALLTADSFCLYKKATDPAGCLFVPCETIHGAEIHPPERGKWPVHIEVSNSASPLIIGLDTKEAAAIWERELKRSKTRKDLQQWLIDGKSVKLEKQIGCGAYGKVWKGNMSGAPVAVKEILHVGDDDAIEQEIHLLSKIRSPYCVRLLGIYREENGEKMFIVTEFLEGGDLSDVLKENGKSLSEEIKLKILRDIARGVAFLHEKNIIHRDLKTDNCLIRSLALDASQHAVVADFGISKFAPNLGTTGSNLTMGVGTPVYMAPECFRKNYTTKLDVYSFGILMNEVFSNERPWCHVDTKFNSAIHNMVDEGKRPRLNFTVQDYPHTHEIVRIITACWDSDPMKRPSMAYVVEQLDKIIEHIESTTPRPPSSQWGSARAGSQPNLFATPQVYSQSYFPQASNVSYMTTPQSTNSFAQPLAHTTPSWTNPGASYASNVAAPSSNLYSTSSVSSVTNNTSSVSAHNSYSSASNTVPGASYVSVGVPSDILASPLYSSFFNESTAHAPPPVTTSYQAPVQQPVQQPVYGRASSLYSNMNPAQNPPKY